jgi:hypothetical protein
MTIDIDQLISDIKNATSSILATDITSVEGFSSRQLDGIATQAALVASGISSGQITDATRDFFLDQLIQLAHNFVNTLVGLVLATIQKLWNAVVAVIWEAISKATGIQLPDFKTS